MILPAVSNLANDSEASVRVRAVHALGSIMTSSSAEKVLGLCCFVWLLFGGE
jgi:hypothetical protein